MKRLTLVVVLCVSSLFSCSDENFVLPTKDSLVGFWTYQKVSYNGLDIAKEIPGFTVSNYLHLKGDNSYGKCYINGEWKVSSKNLTLRQSFANQTMVYEIVKVSKNSLTLQVKARQSEYGISLPQFDDNEIVTITEEFVKVD